MIDITRRLLPSGTGAGRGSGLAVAGFQRRRADPAEPVGILWVPAAERKHRVGKTVAAMLLRVHPHDNGPIAALGDRNPMLGKVCRIHFRKPGRGWGVGDRAGGRLPEGSLAARRILKYAHQGRPNPEAFRSLGPRRQPKPRLVAPSAPSARSFLLFWGLDSSRVRDLFPVRSAIV